MNVDSSHFYNLVLKELDQNYMAYLLEAVKKTKKHTVSIC